MESLRIAVIPNLQRALASPRTFKELLLRVTTRQICARRIQELSIDSAVSMQCVLWVSGTPAAIAALRTYLERRNLSYEQYADDQPTEENPLTKQQE